MNLLYEHSLTYVLALLVRINRADRYNISQLSASVPVRNYGARKKIPVIAFVFAFLPLVLSIPVEYHMGKS
jgi:hypothetical protein